MFFGLGLIDDLRLLERGLPVELPPAAGHDLDQIRIRASFSSFSSPTQRRRGGISLTASAGTVLPAAAPRELRSPTGI